MNLALIKKNFNKASHTYDANAYIQTHIGTELLCLLNSYVTQTDHLIDLGCGTGIITEKLAQSYCYKQFYAIDIADKLLNLAEKRLASYSIILEEKNFDNFYYPHLTFNLMLSNMALHWSSNIKKTLAHLVNQLAEDGLIAFSLPLTNTFYELGEKARLSFHSAPHIELFLAQAGFQLLLFKPYEIAVSFDSALAAMQSIKSVGANYHTIATRGLSGKAYLKNLMPPVIANPFFLTYDIGYFLARKRHA